MGKKKSRRLGNNWDLTAEEQARQLEEFHKFETGQIDLAMLVNENRKPKLNSNGLSAGIEELIIKDMLKRGEVTHSPRPITKMEATLGRTPGTEASNSISGLLGCRKIVFNTKYTDELYKVIIDDEISPTTVSLALALDQDLAIALDVDDTYDKIITLYDYIITQKYPTAIYSEAEFELNYDFSKVVNGYYDESKFRFIRSNGYILCYAIDNESVKRFKEILDDNKYDQTELLKTYLSIADTCRSVMQSFFPEEVWYIEELYNSIYNQKDLFHEVFIHDESIIINETENYPKGIDGIQPEECSLIVKSGKRLIEYLTGEDTLDEEDEMYEEIEEQMNELLQDMDMSRSIEEVNLDEDEDDEEEEVEEDEAVVIEPTPSKVNVEESQIATKTTTELNIKESTVISTENPKEVIASIDKEISDLLSEDMEVVEEKTVTKLKATDNDDFDNFKIPVVRRK